MTEEAIQHVLIPKHEKISEGDKKKLFERYNITSAQLPKIPLTDAGIRHLGAQPGDVIKITRKSETAGETIVYRGVSSE